jgi:S-adenosylmethionine hydrolase
LVGPDNGLGTFLFDWAQEKGESVHFVEMDRPQYWRAEVGSSFHGRDIFAPVAAHLASGVPLSELGTDIDNPVRLNLPQPQRSASGWSGQIIHIDHFGNAESNIRPECFKNETVAVVQAAGQTIEGLSITFGDRQAGEMVAMIDSDGFLAISVVNGSAALQYGLRPGDPIEVILQS